MGRKRETPTKDQSNTVGMDVEAIIESPGDNGGGFSLDLDALRLTQDFAELSGVKKAFLTIPVRKPDAQSFVRVRRGEESSIQTLLLIIKEDRDTFLVSRALWPELQNELVPHLLCPAISRQGVLFLWPIRLPAPDGRQNAWHLSAMQAAHLAETQWVRVQANLNLGAYEVSTATAPLPEPEWPPLSMKELLETAFKDKYIDSLGHPALRRLRGEQ